MSVSRTLRQKGNELYFKGKEAGLSPLVVKSRMSEALKYYYKAKTSSVNNDELSSTMRNIGKASFEMAKVKSRELTLSSRFTEKETIALENEIKFYAKEALSNLFSALHVGRGCKSQGWRYAVSSDISQIFTDVILLVRKFGHFDRRMSSMFVLAEAMAWEELRSVLYVQLATDLSEHATQSLGIQDFQRSLRMIHEMNYPLEEADKVTQSEEMKTDIRVMKEQAILQLATAGKHYQMHIY